jgi:hypothetical protein
MEAPFVDNYKKISTKIEDARGLRFPGGIR